jgi:mannose-6-phosphate isomerase-like protein (cupin superfamily)
MHTVARIDPLSAATPEAYKDSSSGFRRAAYVDRTMGSVHMGTGICFLDTSGIVATHLHSFEETFYVLEGSLIFQIGDRAFQVQAGHFGLIPTGTPHGFRSVGNQTARWLEMQAPQPRPLEYGQDTFFPGVEPPTSAAAPDFSDESTRAVVGYFDESKLPQPGAPSEMEGFNPTTGVAIKMFVDRSFGAVHQSLFLIQYMPGAMIDPHDHTFEESYYIVSGRVKATADGQVYDLGAGDVIWTGVGCIHSFENAGTEPVRWIETQAPLPPVKEVFRFERDWAQYR